MKIFLSHSSLDKNIARDLIELLRAAFPSLETRDITCTSVDGYGFDFGESVNSKIIDGVKNARLLIALITQNSIRSYYFLFELGARWASKKDLIPIISSSVNIDEIKPLIDTNLCRPDKNPAICHTLLANIRDFLGLELEDADIYSGRIEKFLVSLDESYTWGQNALSVEEVDVLQEIIINTSSEDKEVFIPTLIRNNSLYLSRAEIGRIIDKLKVRQLVDHFSDTNLYIGVTHMGMQYYSDFLKNNRWRLK